MAKEATHWPRWSVNFVKKSLIRHRDRTAVVVLDGIGRSPRMQYHALSLARLCVGFRVLNLGTIVHKKTASALCLTSVKNEDKMEFNKNLEAIKANFNDKYDETRKKWEGGVMGSKSQVKAKAKENILAKEATEKMS